MGGMYETLSGAGGIRAQGKSQQNISEYNADVNEMQAKSERARTNFDQMQQAKQAERTKSSLRAKIGAAGGGESPVKLDILKEQANESELEQLLIGFEGETKAGQLEQKAILNRLEGELAYRSGKAAARKANIDFGIQLATLGAGAA